MYYGAPWMKDTFLYPEQLTGVFREEHEKVRKQLEENNLDPAIFGTAEQRAQLENRTKGESTPSENVTAEGEAAPQEAKPAVDENSFDDEESFLDEDGEKQPKEGALSNEDEAAFNDDLITDDVRINPDGTVDRVFRNTFDIQPPTLPVWFENLFDTHLADSVFDLPEKFEDSTTPEYEDDFQVDEDSPELIERFNKYVAKHAPKKETKDPKDGNEK